jgi:hypothetical protein
MWSLFSNRKEQRTFWVTLCVDLAEPLHFTNEPVDGAAEVAVGYYQNFGVTTATATLALEAASSSALQGPTTGIVRSDTTSVREVDARRLDEVIRRRVGNAWKKPGIWYRSGRIFFPHAQPGDGAEH